MTEPADRVSDMPGHWVRRLQQIAVQLFARGMEAAGVDITPVQFAALATVRDRPGIDQATLGAVIGYDRATIGGVVERLEAKGWVHRYGDPADRRLRRLEATAEGLSTLQHIQPWVQQVQDEFVAPMSEPERRKFEQLCRKLLGHHQA